MIKWFKRKLRNWLNDDELTAGLAITVPHDRLGRNMESHGINFTVYHAEGGTVIEMRTYDPKTDRSNNKLYVVHSDQDLGKHIDHIFTLESLRR